MNTSSRMMSFGEEQKIHVSKVTGDLLPKDFKVTERGQIEVKGKGVMTTCWVEDRVGRPTPVKDEVREKKLHAVHKLVPLPSIIPKVHIL